MKRFIALLAAFAAVLAASFGGYASEPDKTGTKLITIQAGYGPGIGGLVSGNVVMANLGSAHLYGGLQAGLNSRHGKATGTHKLDLSLAPRVMLGVNLGRVVELHVGGLAGVDLNRFDTDQSRLLFCYGGFGGLRLNVSSSFGIILEGCYSPHLPYGLGGIAFRF